MKKKKERSPFFESVKAGLEEILLHAEGKIELKTYVVEIAEPPPPITGEQLLALRARLCMTELAFARIVNVPVSTIRAWESGKRKPTGAAARLIQVYDAQPDVVSVITNGKPHRNGKPARTSA
ncbi:MAG TPA: helix-turn-helix domain-containing protein [Gemmataceae bacterium]|jgi:putative transcriptional regulator|nr:helix-turn-helix domain-containing protein [Gemmataceae bacterium]